jgi:hypothetical protein
LALARRPRGACDAAQPMAEQFLATPVGNCDSVARIEYFGLG